MRTVQLDYLDQARSGLHLEREITGHSSLHLDKFHPKDQRIIMAFRDLSFGAPDGLEAVVALDVEILTKDGAWHFGDNDFTQSKAGMWVIGSNHVQVWLRDKECKPILHVASLFHEELRTLLEENKGEFENLVKQRAVENIWKQQEKKQQEIDATTDHLRTLVQEERLLQKFQKFM